MQFNPIPFILYLAVALIGAGINSFLGAGIALLAALLLLEVVLPFLGGLFSWSVEEFSVYKAGRRKKKAKLAENAEFIKNVTRFRDENLDRLQIGRQAAQEKYGDTRYKDIPDARWAEEIRREIEKENRHIKELQDTQDELKKIKPRKLWLRSY